MRKLITNLIRKKGFLICIFIILILISIETIFLKAKTNNSLTVINGEGTKTSTEIRITDEYIKLNYIESNGKQFLNTNYVPNSKTTMILDFENTNTSINSVIYCARGVETTSDTFTAFYLNGSIRLDYGNYQNHTNISIEQSTRNQLIISPGKLTLNGEEYEFQTTGLSDAKGTLAFFASYTGNSEKQSYYSYMKLYGAKIYENDNLIHEYIPAQRVSDKKIGLYDKKDNIFFENSGSEEFSYITSQTPNTGDIVKVSASTITGYNWESWVTNDESILKGSTQIEYTFTMPETGVTLTATALPKEYTITLNPNGATTIGTGSVKAIYNSCDLEDNIINPTKENATFYGWSLYPNSNNILINYNGELIKNVENYTDANGKWIYDGDITLYASWANEIVFDLAKGCISFSSSIYSGKDSEGNTITGTHILDNKYVITQSNNETITENTITFSESCDIPFDITLKNVNMGITDVPIRDTDFYWEYEAQNRKGMIFIPAIETKKVTLKLSGENAVRAIRYYTSDKNYSTPDDCNKDSYLKITSASGDGQEDGILYLPKKVETENVIDFVNSNEEYNHYATVIGSEDNRDGVTGITIEGGTIQALTTNVDSTTAIGAGANGYAEIKITGGKIVASSNSTGATIGGGTGVRKQGGDSTIEITGGKIYANNYSLKSFHEYKKTAGGVAIGGGSSFGDVGNSSNITITGGIVEAFANDGNGIGGGNSVCENGGEAIVTITGGTIRSNNIGGGFSKEYGYAFSEVMVNGGTINSQISTQPTNGSRNVYLTRATLYSKDVAMTNQAISSLKEIGLTSNYGLNDVKTDENGTLYIWTPSGSVITGANDGTNDYEGSVASKTVGILQHNSSKQYYATKISYNRDIALYTDKDLTSEFSGSLMAPSNTNTSFWIKTNTYDTDKYYGVNVYMSDGTEMKKIEPTEADTSNGIYKYTINITSDNYMWIETNENNSNKKLSIDLSLGNAVIENKKVTVNGYTLDSYDGDFYLTSAGLGVTNNLILKSGIATITTNSLVISSTTSGIFVENGELNLYSSTSNDSITSTDEPAVKLSKGATFNMYDTVNGSIELKTTKAETSAIGGSGSVMISKNGGFMTLTQGENATDITAENYTFVAQKQLSNSELPYNVTLVGRTFIGYSSLYKDGSTTKMYNQTDKHTTTDKNEEFKAIGVEYINYGNETIVPTINNNNVEFAVSGIASGRTLTAHVQNGGTLLSNTDYTWIQKNTTGTLIVNGSSINEHLVVAVIEADELAIVVDAVDKTFEYDNTPHSIEVRVIFPTTGVKLEYSTDSKSLNSDGTKNESANWSETNPEFNTVGIHNVYWVASAEHYNNKTGSNKITITKATNYFTSGGVMIESINKGGTLNPNATSKYGTPYYEYSSSYNGTYTTKEPTEAGIYYVRAVVKGTNEYTEIISEPVAFFIEDPTIYVLGMCSWEKINTIGAEKDQTVTISKDKEISTLMNFNYVPDKTNSNYITFEFSESPSIGTTLKLIDFSDTENTYVYYYPVTTEITKVASNEFMKIGTATKETFEKTVDGETANVLYQLNIKYKEMPSSTSTLKITKKTGNTDVTLMTPVTLKVGNQDEEGSILVPTVTMSENNHKVTIATKITDLAVTTNFSNVLTVSLFESNGTTAKAFSDNVKVEINGKQTNINGNLATIGDIENGNVETIITGLNAGSYKVKIGIANVRNNLNDIKFPMKSRIENVSKEVDFVIARYPSYALNVKTEKIEDRIVNTAEESKTISLNLKYKAVNTIETPSVYVVVKKKSNDTNYNTIINNWTYTLADQIKDTTNSTDKIESTTMTLNIPQGSENGFYRVFITIGDKTTSLNIVIYDGEMSEVIVGQNDT